MDRIRIIIPLLIIAMAFGIHGFTGAENVNLDALKTIANINGESTSGGSVSGPNGVVYQDVPPLVIVAKPDFYVGKNVKFKAKFDKFSTLGLDYQPALRSSEKYISLLIQRTDVADHDVPLSELKIFMDRKEAEKYIDLNSGDEVEICGKVFSRALGDAWMDVARFTVIKTVPKTEK